MGSIVITSQYAEPDYLGVNDWFRKISNEFVSNAVKENTWFSFGRRINDKQVDIIRIKNDEGVSLGRMLYDSEYSEDVEMDFLIGVYKYFLRNYMCYYEAPIVVKERDLNGWRNSYNKYIVTSNISVVAMWMGISDEDAERQYGGKLDSDDNESSLIPYYKLYTNKDGVHKLTNTRNPLDLSISGTRIIPMYALKNGVDVLYNKLLEDTYTVTFFKDSGQERKLNTTFNIDKIKDVYGKRSDYIVDATEKWYQGDFNSNTAMERGYIRVFEMGSSIYDSPLRSINYARIVDIKQEQPDLSYLNIDINSVMDSFKDYVRSSTKISKEINELVDDLDAFEVGTTRVYSNVRINSVFTLVNWAESQYTLLSTVFLRQLSLFMLGNPQWFEGYTGQPYTPISGGVDGWDDDLDLG